MAGSHRAVLCIGLTLGGSLVSAASAAVSYRGGVYAQDFDTLATASGPLNLNNWQDDVTLAGWYRRGTSDGTPEGDLATLRYRVSNGVASSGSLYSYGAYGSTDRALGFMCSSNIVAMSMGVMLVNDTGSTLSAFSLRFTVEQWRAGPGVAHPMTFAWGLGNAGILDGDWRSEPALEFLSLQSQAAGIGNAIDGNDAANRSVLEATILANWLPGQALWLRWSGVDQPGGDHGFAVDDLTFSAIPCPGVVSLLGLASLAVPRRR